MEEGRHAEKDGHRQQPGAPQDQRVLLSIFPEAGAALPGQGEYPQQGHGQEPYDLPAQRLVEEPQQAGIARIKHTGAATSAVSQTLGWLTGTACPREVSTSECASLYASRRRLLGRVPTRTAGVPTAKAELSQQALDAVVAEGQANFRIVLARTDIGPVRSWGQVYCDGPGE